MAEPPPRSAAPTPDRREAQRAASLRANLKRRKDAAARAPSPACEPGGEDEAR